MSMNPDRNYFKEFKGDCDVFVETGTYMGGGITLAVLAGFTEIHSIDLKDQIPPDYKHGLKAIYRHIGDSAERLRELLPELQEKKIMFWLDAHSQMTEGEQDSFPLMKELEAIKKSGVKNAVILIDDFLYMSHPDITGFTKSQIVKALKDINPSYEISYLPNPVKNNILLARPKATNIKGELASLDSDKGYFESQMRKKSDDNSILRSPLAAKTGGLLG